MSLVLTGCSLPWNGNGSSPDIPSNGAATVNEQASTVTLDIYPENNKYELVDKFDRAEYRRLSDVQKGIYIIIDNAVYKMTTGYINLGLSSRSDVETAYRALRHDRPEYFWLPSFYTLRSSGNCYEICFAAKSDGWLYTPEERRIREAEIRQTLSGFLATLDGGLSEFDRELAAHDMLAENIVYDNKALENSESRAYAWNAVGAFCYGKAVCEGYSRAMQIMCFMLGLDCAVITGATTEPHMWNVVKIGGNWYHLDLTSDDGDNDVYHFFFNVTTEYMLKSRTIDPAFTELSEGTAAEERYNTFLPICNATEYNYHTVKSLYIADKSQSDSVIISAICNAVRSGYRSVEFAVSPELEFVFGYNDAARVFRLERCISAANAELSVSQQLRSYSYGGVNGALGFVISW